MITDVFDFLPFEGTKWFVAVDWPRPQRRSNWQTAGIGNPLQHFVFPASEAFPQISSFSCLCSTFIRPVVIDHLYYPNHPEPLTIPSTMTNLTTFCPAALQIPTTLTTLLPWHLWFIAWTHWSTPSPWPRNFFCENWMEQQYAKVIQYYQLFRKTLFKICTHKKIQKGKMQNFEHVCLEPKSAKFKKSLTKLG